MTAVARSLYLVRRRVGERWMLLVVATLWPLLAVGLFRGDAVWSGRLPQVSAITVLGVTLLWATIREMSAARARAAGSVAVRELELGLLLLTAVYVLVASTGGLRSFLYPLVYAVVSFLTIVLRHRLVAVAILGAVVVLELAVGWRTIETGGWSLMAYHLTFVGFFAAGNHLVLASLVRRLRGDHQRRVDDALERMRQEARDFRLIASQLPPESRARSREQEESRMAHAGVESIHEQLFHNLDLLRTSLGLGTCALLWCDGSSDERARSKGVRAAPGLVVKELATSSELVADRPTLSSPGILTSVLADPKPLRLKALGGKRLPPYYQGPESVTDFCAVPLLDGANLRGILCADRSDDRPFCDEEERVLQQAASHILRVIEHERVFTAVERGKYEQEQFYRASEMLNEALTLGQVYERSFAAVRAIAPYDLAVITTTEGESREHRVVAVDAPPGEGEGEDAGRRGEDVWAQVAERLRGLVFDDAASLVAMAVKNRHYMPAGSDVVDSDTVVFNARTRLRAAKSLLVLPLVRGDQVLGAITLAAARPNQFREQTREMLRVISHQVGVSLQNARMYQSMEQRATTDGLTGLTNHRAFQERLEHLHALAERTNQKYSIILTDIDHFKSINDTYGHPIGDQVLKKVSAIFAGRARKVDIVARYGGEEFVLVLPDTDAIGAEHFANKIREEVAEQVMASEHGNFKITISMGIAEFPADGAHRLELIEKADQALYYCKEHGRNCVRRHGASR
jgi:two-component system, cell cycle response regulator